MLQRQLFRSLGCLGRCFHIQDLLGDRSLICQNNRVFFAFHCKFYGLFRGIICPFQGIPNFPHLLGKLICSPLRQQSIAICNRYHRHYLLINIRSKESVADTYIDQLAAVTQLLCLG